MDAKSWPCHPGMRRAQVQRMTYAQVIREALNTAGDLDTLDMKADLINRVAERAAR